MKFNVTNVIGFKKAVLISSLIGIFCCTIEIVSYYNSSKILYDSVCQSYVNKAVDNSNLLSGIFKDKIIALGIIAEEDDIRSMDWTMQKKALLKHIDTLEAKKFRVLDKNGFSKSTDENDLDLSDREFFKIAISGTPNISDVLVSKFDRSLVVSCATPIKDYDNNIVGVLVSIVDYQMLSDVINNIKIGQEGYATLINYKGVAVAHPKKEMILSNETIFEQAKKDPNLKDLVNIQARKINGETGLGFYKYDNLIELEAFTPVKGTNWILGLTIPKNEAFIVLNSLRKKFILETITFILIAFLLYYLIANYFSQKRKVLDLQKNADESQMHLIKLTEIDKIKTEFFSNITHELRTPINVIYVALQLFEHSVNNAADIRTKDMVKRIKTIKQNCFRLLRLINNLIDATKIDSGYLELNLENDDIIQVVENITLSVADYIKDKGIDLIFDTEIEEKIIAFDHDKIERIILNLLSNAIKFTNANGSVFVNIFDKGDMIAISVKDTGIGIPNDMQKIIFERFRQVNQSLTRNHEGSGIGLSLVKSLVEMHGGKISVRSELGKGSEFVVEIPVKVLPEESKAESNNYYKGVQGHVEKINVEFSDIYFK